MKTRTRLTIGSSWALLALGAVVLAPMADAGNQGMVVGAGENNPPNGQAAQFNIDARSDGLTATGHVSFNVKSENPEGTWSGTVMCLNVVGNRATIGVQLDRTKETEPPFDIVWVEDNGAPQGGTPVDFVKNRLQASPPTCQEPFLKNEEPINKGNVTVFPGS